MSTISIAPAPPFISEDTPPGTNQFPLATGNRFYYRTLTASRVTLLGALTLATLAFGAVEGWAWGALAVLVMAALMLWVWAGVSRDSVRLVWTPLYLPAAAFLLLGTVQFAARTTADAVAARESLLKLLVDLAIFFLAVHLWDAASPARYRRLGVTITVLAGGLAMFAILQFFASPSTIYGVVKPRWGGWIFGPYVNHNHYAGLMEMLIPIALLNLVSFRMEPVRRRGTILAGSAILIALASVLLSGSRGGMISLTVEGVILTVILLRCVGGARRRRLALAGVVGLAATAALFLWLDPGSIARRLGALADLPSAPEATLGERRLVARDTLRMFRRHPGAGTGLGSFETEYPRYRTFASDLEWDHAHNDYAEALAETGITGGVAILAALALFLRFAFTNLAERLEDHEGWIRLGAALGCCGLLAHSLGDFNLHIPANAAWFSLCAGLAAGGRRTRRL